MRTSEETAPVVFKNGAAFRRWLDRHHATAEPLAIRLFKVHALDQGMGYAAALDEALCYGWIDGIRRSLDADSFSVRFSRRQPRSIWSRVNLAHIKRLTDEGRMKPPGIAALKALTPERTGLYSFERAAMTIDPLLEKRFRANRRAWKYWEAEAPWYRKTATHYVMSAKRAETRERRLLALIDCSAAGERIGLLRRD
jgi:uncharacterized protein YdeI (YjbR/CyaY-like superfamily)